MVAVLGCMAGAPGVSTDAGSTPHMGSEPGTLCARLRNSQSAPGAPAPPASLELVAYAFECDPGRSVLDAG